MKVGVTRSFAVAIAATMVAGLAAPARAADTVMPQPRRVPLSVTAASMAAQAGASAVEETAPASPAAEETSKGFWKSPKGIVTAVLLAGGLGWVIYSKSHDRVRSPANQ